MLIATTQNSACLLLFESTIQDSEDGCCDVTWNINKGQCPPVPCANPLALSQLMCVTTLGSLLRYKLEGLDDFREKKVRHLILPENRWAFRDNKLLPNGYHYHSLVLFCVITMYAQIKRLEALTTRCHCPITGSWHEMRSAIRGFLGDWPGTLLAMPEHALRDTKGLYRVTH
ncbi:hypothetical protein ACJJTC_004042 [Scirpophaga incertulas]